MFPYVPESCNPTQTVTCPTSRTVAPVYPDGFQISDGLKNLLIASVACGDDALDGMLRDNFEVISCIAGVESCVLPNLSLIRLQVGLADYALDAARNLVDQFVSRGDGFGEAHFRGSSYRDAEAAKQSQGTSKFRSRGNSYNNFERTSESHESSFSTSRAQADGTFRNEGTDTSYRQQNSTVASFDDADVKGTGAGNGHSSYFSTRNSSASSRTAPNPRISPPAPFKFPKITIINVGTVPVPLFGTQWFAVDVNPEPDHGAPICSNSTANPDVAPTACNDIRPSIGQGFKSVWNGNATATLGISIPFVGSVSLTYGFSNTETISAHYRQQMVCSVGRSTVDAVSASDITYEQRDEMKAIGETHLSAVGRDIHAIQRAGNSLRTSTSKLHAESTGRMDSCGESHSFSTRQAHGEAQNTGQSTSRSEGHSESENKFINRSKTIATARYFNQVFKQLKQLRDLLWTRLLDEEARVRVRKGPLADCAPRRGLTTKPLFWYANNMVCGRCFNSNCKCVGSVADGGPVSEFAFNGACR